MKSSLLWCDKYRPRTFKDLIYHKEIGQLLQSLIKQDDFPHLLFHGISGAGKKTLIGCVLRQLFGISADRLKIEQLEFTVPTTKKKVEITAIGSPHHIMVTPSDLGLQDRIVVQEVINNLAASNSQVMNSASGSKGPGFKVIVLDECDSLSRDAQDALRRTMEVCARQCRIFLCCTSTSSLIPALKSRVLSIRVPAPSDEEIKETLEFVIRKENLSKCDRLNDKIVSTSNGNSRRALLVLEACKAEKYPWTDDQEIVEEDWLVFIRATASMIVQEQSAKRFDTFDLLHSFHWPRRLIVIRDRLYKLLETQVPPSVIFKELFLALAKLCDDSHVRLDVCRLAAECEHLCCQGQKPIMHLESFVAQFMYSYKTFIDQMM